METLPAPDIRPAKKRRIPKACAACRKSKVRCDERRPCSRCINARVECVYFEKPKDPNLIRIERLEKELDRLSQGYGAPPVCSHEQPSPSTNDSVETFQSSVDAARTQASLESPSFPAYSRSQTLTDTGKIVGVFVGFTIRRPQNVDVVSTGLVSDADAVTWFSTFFEGCDRFVPVFYPMYDTYDAVRNRSSTLFDIIVIFGARAAQGSLSRSYQKLYGLLRQHTSDLVLRLSGSPGHNISIEDVQALLVVASYSDSGAILCDIATRASIEAGFSSRVDDIFAAIADNTLLSKAFNHSWFASARVWYYVYVLDMILSLDGGKPPSISLRSPPGRVKVLLNHPEHIALDTRLFAQVELNALRSTAHTAIASVADSSTMEASVAGTVSGAILDLNLWLSEWQDIVANDTETRSEYNILSLNLRIQHAWAILTLHLRALTTFGIENIAVMTDSQRNIALAAKTAAERHLQLLLSSVQTGGVPREMGPQVSYRPYVTSFKYAMEFVWAKNAFCVLIVLRLGFLLGDSPNQLIARLAEAKEFLHELDETGIRTNVSYSRILADTVDKCEKAVDSSLQSFSRRNSAEPGDGDFQSFLPNEFMFKWDFPGLHLCYIPFDWQDLFLDFAGPA